MRVEQLKEEQGVVTQLVTLTNAQLTQAITDYLNRHHASGLTINVDSLIINDDHTCEFTATGIPGNPIDNPGDTLRATPTPTRAGEVPTASDAQRIANGLPPRL